MCGGGEGRWENRGQMLRLWVYWVRKIRGDRLVGKGKVRLEYPSGAVQVVVRHTVEKGV